MKKKWDQHYCAPNNRLRYPSELVIKFAFGSFPGGGKSKILDLGCGTGRHVLFLAKENFSVYGVDFSKEAINFSKELLERHNLKAELKVSGVDNLPFENDFFDGIISYGVLYYCGLTEIRKSVDEIYRVLKKGGRGFILVRNTKDFRYGRGEEIEKNTFVLTEEDKTKTVFNKNGMTKHFFKKDEIKEFFSHYSELSIDEKMETRGNGSYTISDYKVYFKK